MEVDGVNLPFLPIGGVDALRQTKVPAPTNPAFGKSDFQKIFEAEVNNLKFSAHAKARLTSREISLTDADIAKLHNAIQTVEAKGGRESLVVFSDKSFLVSIPNRTVITVFSNNNLEERVITNIDSVIFES
jgi:flagellar operon protein